MEQERNGHGIGEGLVEDSVGLHDQQGNGVFLGRFGVGCDIPGGYKTLFICTLSMEIDTQQLILVALIHLLLIAVILAMLAQNCVFQGYVWKGPPQHCGASYIVCECSPWAGTSFLVFFGPPWGIRSYKCPDWIDSLQQVELFAILQVYELEAYLKWCRVLSGDR